jgi:hypothetical protein
VLAACLQISTVFYKRGRGRGVPRILPGGDAHFWLTYPLPPPGSGSDPDPHQDFELDPDPAPDPHQNNADPQPWAQLSKDCCLIYNLGEAFSYPKANRTENRSYNQGSVREHGIFDRSMFKMHSSKLHD